MMLLEGVNWPSECCVQYMLIATLSCFSTLILNTHKTVYCNHSEQTKCVRRVNVPKQLCAKQKQKTNTNTRWMSSAINDKVYNRINNFPKSKNSDRYNEPVCRNWPIDHLPNAFCQTVTKTFISYFRTPRANV